MSGQITIRPARPEDALALAELHVAVWRQSYANLAPSEALKRLDVSRRLPTWQSYIADPSHLVMVADAAGALVGVACYGPPSHGAFGKNAEIKHLYVAAHTSRQGLGKALLFKTLANIHQAGFSGAALAVVRGNKAAVPSTKGTARAKWRSSQTLDHFGNLRILSRFGAT